MKNNKFQFYDLKINMKVEHMKKNRKRQILRLPLNLTPLL